MGTNNFHRFQIAHTYDRTKLIVENLVYSNFMLIFAFGKI